MFSFVMLPVAIARSGLTETWWTPVSLLLVIVPSAALVVESFRAVPRCLTSLVFACAAGYLIAILLWFPAWLGNPDPDARWAVWLFQFPSVPSFGLVVVLRPVFALANVVVATFAVHVVNQIARYGELRPLELLSVPQSVALASVFIAVAIATSRNIRALDAQHPAVVAVAASAAAQAAQDAERARFDALIHDRVIATLLAVRVGAPDPRLAGQATAALAALEVAADRPPVVSVDDLVAGIESEARTVSDEIAVSADVADGLLVYPAEVAEVVTASLGEAVRNWARHAGDGANCVVDVDLTADGVSIGVTDDGVGFDPEAVDARSFGLEVGIRARMRSLPGGSATISSLPGVGTTVVMRWRRV